MPVFKHKERPRHALPDRSDARIYRTGDMGELRADGLLLVCEPATSLPMTQRYFLF